MQVVDVGQRDVERGALDVAGRDAGASEVDDHLALRGYGRGDEARLVRGVLQGEVGAYDGGGCAGGYLSGKTAEHTAGGLVFEGSYFGGHTVYGAGLLKGIVGQETTAIDIGRVEGVVDIAEQAALGERGLPDAQLVDVAVEAFAQSHHGTLHGGHVGLGNDSSALTVDVERGSLTANDIQGQVIGALQVGEVLDAGHRGALLTVVQMQVVGGIVVEAQAVLRHTACLEDCGLPFWLGVHLRPQLDGIAVATTGVDARDVSLGRLVGFDVEHVVGILNGPSVLQCDVMRMALVGDDVAVSLVHGPVVHQSIDIVVFRLILRGSCLGHVAVDVKEAQVMDLCRDRT